MDSLSPRSGSLWIVTWLHEATHDEWGTYAQVHGRSSDKAVRDVYRRTVCVFFHCARLFAPDARLALVTNIPNAAQIDGVSIRHLLETLGVTIKHREYTERPPAGWRRDWLNQFYVIDAVESLLPLVSPDDSVALLDADCIVRRPLDALHEDIERHGSQAYLLPFAPDHVENGLSPAQLQQLAFELGWKKPLGYCGGEFIALRGDHMPRYVHLMRQCWTDAKARFESGRMHPREEAHLWSLVSAQMGANMHGDRHIRRIWTGLKHRDASALDDRLAVWHLPSEKTTGIRRFWELRTRRVPVFGLGDPTEVSAAIPRLMGVPTPGASKTLMDLIMRLHHRFELARDRSWGPRV